MHHHRRRRVSRKTKTEDLTGIAVAIGAAFFIDAWVHHPRLDDAVGHLIGVGLFFAVVFAGLVGFIRKKQRGRLRAALLAAGTANPMQLTPEQYERFCAALLSNNGWHTSVTRKSGDFGADVIARKGGLVLAIQCKQWSKSVGVKAVQEVHAALSHYGATQGIVVTTTGYTPAAHALAASTGVRLLSHTDLIGM